ncbi:class I SAM-dependent methyltransferase [Stratiformator vulcanicus]|nr:class I SAM-dependent methyltransferase [Stratiformator vulcanicus]
MSKQHSSNEARLNGDVTERVRSQYEQLPYPHREPADERKRLCMTELDDLNIVNHYCFGGERDLSGGLRILVAGGGTGDSLVFLAEQLRDTPSELVYVDLSDAAMKIARERVRIRGLDSLVQWHRRSLLDIAEMDFEPFDFINCSGVLHHLENPADGLAALKSVLKPDGGMALMVYGEMGRTGVYQIQRLMRIAAANASSEQEKIDLTRTMLSNLPKTNWFVAGGGLNSLTADSSDAEIYDLFLHSQDRPFSVDELYGWVEEAGLHVAEFTMQNRMLYEPAFLLGDSNLVEELSSLPDRQRRAAGELISGSIAKHNFWVSARAESKVDGIRAEYVPCLSQLGQQYDVLTAIEQAKTPNVSIQVNLQNGSSVKLAIAMNDSLRAMAKLIDGSRSLLEIVVAIVGPGASREKIDRVWSELQIAIGTLRQIDFIVFRQKVDRRTQAA